MTEVYQHVTWLLEVVVFLVFAYLVARLIGRAFALSWFEVQGESEEKSFDKLFEEGERHGEEPQGRKEEGQQHERSGSQTGRVTQ